MNNILISLIEETHFTQLLRKNQLPGNVKSLEQTPPMD